MRTFRPLTAAAIAMALAAPALAQQSQQNRQQNQQRQRIHQQQSKTGSQQQVSMQDVRRQVEGEVISARTCRLKGKSQPHVLAKVRQQNGQTVVLDLGPVNNLQQKNVQLSQGTQLKAAGQPGRINDQPILIVDRFIGDGQFTMLIPLNQREAQQMQQQTRAQQQARMNQQRRQQQPQQLRRGQANMQQARFQQQRQAQQSRQQMGQQGQAMTKAAGTLTDMRKVRLRGLSGEHNLAKLRTSGGRTIIVDLGTESINELKLSRGEIIAVSGVAGRINGKPVIFAQQVADLARIDRSQEQRRQQNMSQKRR